MKTQLSINYYNNILPFKSKPNNVFDNAIETSKKFQTNGFRNTKEELFNFVSSELQEFRNAVNNHDTDNMEEELGDILFDTIMLADNYNIDPEKALKRTTKKINDRFNMIDTIIHKPLMEYSIKERLDFWEVAKEKLRSDDINPTNILYY